MEKKTLLVFVKDIEFTKFFGVGVELCVSVALLRNRDFTNQMGDWHSFLSVYMYIVILISTFNVPI